MLQIPSELQIRFEALLNRKGIPEPYRLHYKIYRHILKKEPGNLKNTVRAKRKPYCTVKTGDRRCSAIFLPS
jgi:hypothetical protein